MVKCNLKVLFIVLFLFSSLFYSSWLIYAQNPEAPKNPETPKASETVLVKDQKGEGGVTYNREAPNVLRADADVLFLKMKSPQWIVQQLEWPTDREITEKIAKATEFQKENFINWVKNVLKPEFIPNDLISNVLPMADWAILFMDWKDKGGMSTFLVKYLIKDDLVQITETPNFVIVVFRNVKNNTALPPEKHIDLVQKTAEKFLIDEIVPKSRKDMRLTLSKDKSITEGFWDPKIRTSEKHITKYDAFDNIKFCTDGNFIGFAVAKANWEGYINVDPYESRFEKLSDYNLEVLLMSQLEDKIDKDPNITPEEKMRVYDKIISKIVLKQAKEYFGPFAYDYNREKVYPDVPVNLLEDAFSRLSDAQKVALVESRTIDEHYLKGLQRFKEEKYDEAIKEWYTVLSLDPLHARAALWLEIASKYLNKPGTPRASLKSDDIPANKAEEALLRHKEALKEEMAKREKQKELERKKDELRIRALELYAQDKFKESYDLWEEMLKIDPADTKTILFRDITYKQYIEQKKKEAQTQKK